MRGGDIVVANKHWLSNIVPVIRVVAEAIKKESNTINSLNVFPVADGDTGTNMFSTIFGTLNHLTILPPDSTPQAVLRAIVEGAGRNARGNSGVLLAAMIKGAAEVLMDAEELTVELLALALNNADVEARKVVATPVEGTMLTVIREMAEAADAAHKAGVTSIAEAARWIWGATAKAVEKTPELLLELAGKIDSGAYGLGLIVQTVCSLAIRGVWEWTFAADELNVDDPKNNLQWEMGQFLYCTEFLLHGSLTGEDEAVIRQFLSEIGDSGHVLSINANTTKVHVHTNIPHGVLRLFLGYGELSDVMVHNMRLQTEENRQRLLREGAPHGESREVGFVVVAQGAGMVKLLKAAGADIIVAGGQSDNPSVGEISEAVNRLNADTVIVLTSNPNVRLAAESAAKQTDKPCFVVPTTSALQSLLIMEERQTWGNASEIVGKMKQSSESMKVYQITTAVRDSDIDGLTVQAGQFIGLWGDEIVATSMNFEDAVEEAMSRVAFEESLLVCIGADCEYEAETLSEIALEYFPKLDVTVVQGDQPVYWVMIGGV